MDISVGVPWKHLTLVFMPAAMEAIDRIEAIVKRTPKETDALGLVSIDMLERFRKAAASLGRSENVRSLGAIVTRMTEIVEAHLAQTEKPASEVQAAEPAATEFAEPATTTNKRKPRSKAA